MPIPAGVALPVGIRGHELTVPRESIRIDAGGHVDQKLPTALIDRRADDFPMPSTRSVDRPREARAAAKRYLRRERPLSALIVVLAVAGFLGTFVATSLAPAVAVGVLLIVVVRAPVIEARGTVRLRTDEDAESVAESFRGLTPPILVFQWGIADEILTGDETVTYRLSYLFGLRSVEVTVETRTDRTPGGGRRIELELTVGGQPWSTYVVTVDTRDDGTVVEYEYTADRRFGLRRIPQRIVAKRHRDEALEAQGYVVVERNEQYGVAI
jgi:hypothetical protein